MAQSAELHSVSEMQSMLPKLKALNNERVDKHIIYVYMSGLKLLKESFERREAKSELLLIWFDGYLNLANLIPPTDQQLHHKYVKTMPSAIIYVICCLSYKAFHVPHFHYTMLKQIYNVLTAVVPAILEKIIKQTDIIYYLWHIVKFVGDYPAQVLCLRLMKMLLQFLSHEQFTQVMQNIEFPDTAELSGLMQLPSYAIPQFENYCREFLNNYNFHAKERYMVYSFCCEAVALGEQLLFYKIFHAEKFWLDLNYRTGTLTFEGRTKVARYMPYKYMQIRLNVRQVAIKDDYIEVSFEPPIEPLEGSCSDFKQLHNNIAKIFVTEEEYKMLLADKDILYKFNKKPIENTVPEVKNLTPFKLHYFEQSENKQLADKEKPQFGMSSASFRKLNFLKSSKKNAPTSKIADVKPKLQEQQAPKRHPVGRRRKVKMTAAMAEHDTDATSGEKSSELDSRDGDWFKQHKRGKRVKQRRKKPIHANPAAKSANPTVKTKRQIQKVVPLSKDNASNVENNITKSNEKDEDKTVPQTKDSIDGVPSVETVINVTNYEQQEEPARASKVEEPATTNEAQIVAEQLRCALAVTSGTDTIPHEQPAAEHNATNGMDKMEAVAVTVKSEPCQRDTFETIDIIELSSSDSNEDVMVNKLLVNDVPTSAAPIDEPAEGSVQAHKRPDTPVPSAYRFFTKHRPSMTSTQVQKAFSRSNLKTIGEEVPEQKSDYDKENIYELQSDDSDGPSTSYAAAMRRQKRKRTPTESLNQIFASYFSDDMPNNSKE